MTIKFGIVGYGTGGQHFHAPFIHAAENCELTAIVARAPETVAKVKADWPTVQIFSSLGDLIGSGCCDAVTITTPPETRKDLVLEAMEGGLHVIADKPFAPNADGALLLHEAAQTFGVTLGVYHNRRWDSDIQTVAKLINDHRLGDIWRIHSCMEFDDPATLEAGPTGGLLRDLGSHLVDQMLWLLGPVMSVHCQLDHIDLPEGSTDAGFTITLVHVNGKHSHISASKLNRFNHRELRVFGSLGGYVSCGTDIQAQSIFAGQRPHMNLDTWGYEPESHWGSLSTPEGTQRVPAEQGNYHDYYRQFAESIRNGTEPPVTALDGFETLKVLDAARLSAETGTLVSI